MPVTSLQLHIIVRRNLGRFQKPCRTSLLLCVGHQFLLPGRSRHQFMCAQSYKVYKLNFQKFCGSRVIEPDIHLVLEKFARNSNILKNLIILR